VIEEISDFLISLLPSTPLFFILYLFLFLVISSFFILFFSKKFKKNPDEKKLMIDDLIKIAANPNSTTDDLFAALKLFNNNFSFDEKGAFDFVEKVLMHKNRKKILFDYFHNEIINKHSLYKNKLEKIERKALNK